MRLLHTKLQLSLVKLQLLHSKLQLSHIKLRNYAYEIATNVYKIEIITCKITNIAIITVRLQINAY